MIVAISGKAGAGKDEVAGILCKEFGFVRVSLADPLKRFAQDVFQFSDEQLWGPSEKRNAPDKRYPRGLDELQESILKGLRVPRDIIHPDSYLTPRYALQQLGTNWGRACYENVWVEYTMRTAKRLMTGPYIYSAKEGLKDVQGVRVAAGTMAAGGVAIPDVRFKNEVDGLKKAGATLIRVKRPMAGLEGSAGAHRSETEQDEIPDSDFDFVINNDGSLEDLCLQVEQVMRCLKAEWEERGRAETFAEALQNIGKGEYVLCLPDDGATNPPQMALEKVVSLDQIPLGGGVLSDLLKKREEDVKAGRLMEYDESQKDVPPFKRKKKS